MIASRVVVLSNNIWQLDLDSPSFVDVRIPGALKQPFQDCEIVYEEPCDCGSNSRASSSDGTTNNSDSYDYQEEYSSPTDKLLTTPNPLGDGQPLPPFYPDDDDPGYNYTPPAPLLTPPNVFNPDYYPTLNPSTILPGGNPGELPPLNPAFDDDTTTTTTGSYWHPGPELNPTFYPPDPSLTINPAWDGTTSTNGYNDYPRPTQGVPEIIPGIVPGNTRDPIYPPYQPSFPPFNSQDPPRRTTTLDPRTETIDIGNVPSPRPPYYRVSCITSYEGVAEHHILRV